MIGKDIKDLKCKMSTTNYARAKTVMNTMISIAIDKNILTETSAEEYGRNTLAVENDRIFGEIYMELMSKLHPPSDTSRGVSFANTAYSTVANKIYKENKLESSFCHRL